MNIHKSVTKRTHLKFAEDFPGLYGVNIMAHKYPIEPFLVFTEFRMDRPVFGPHPHAGVSVMTYMLPDSAGSFINRDSTGDFSIIEPGGVHIMQAGSGMLHDEFPKERGVVAHGFQIWINHSDKNRLVTPASMHADAVDVPELITKDYKVRVVHGAFDGISPKYQMVTDVSLLHIFLQPDKTLAIPAREMAFVYGLNGSGSAENHAVNAQTLINFSEAGDYILLEAGKDGLECMFADGTPHHEPITYGGPFVMTTAAQMLDAKRRYANGEMGTLEPYQY